MGASSSSTCRPPGGGLGCLFKACAKAPIIRPSRSRVRTSVLQEQSSATVDFAGVQVYFNYFGNDPTPRHNRNTVAQISEQVLQTVEQHQQQEVLQDAELGVVETVETLPVYIESRTAQPDSCVATHQELLDELEYVPPCEQEVMQDPEIQLLEVLETSPVRIETLTALADSFKVVADDSTTDVVGLTDDEDDVSSIDAMSDLSEDVSELQTNLLLNNLADSQTAPEPELSEEDKLMQTYMLPLPFVKKSSPAKKKLASTMPKTMTSSFNLNSSAGLVLPHYLVASAKVKQTSSNNNAPSLIQHKVPLTGSMASMLLNLKATSDSGSSRSSSPFLRGTTDSSPSPFARSSISSFSKTLPSHFNQFQ